MVRISYTKRKSSTLYCVDMGNGKVETGIVGEQGTVFILFPTQEMFLITGPLTCGGGGPVVGGPVGCGLRLKKKRVGMPVVVTKPVMETAIWAYEYHRPVIGSFGLHVPLKSGDRGVWRRVLSVIPPEFVLEESIKGRIDSERKGLPGRILATAEDRTGVVTPSGVDMVAIGDRERYYLKLCNKGNADFYYNAVNPFVSGCDVKALAYVLRNKIDIKAFIIVGFNSRFEEWESFRPTQGVATHIDMQDNATHNDAVPFKSAGMLERQGDVGVLEQLKMLERQGDVGVLEQLKMLERQL